MDRRSPELLMDAEEDAYLRAVLVGMLEKGAIVGLGSWAHHEPVPHGDPAV